MKIRRIIGVLMFVPITIVILEFYSTKKKIRDAFELAREEVIFSSDQLELNETQSFKTTYPYAHGVFIRNAEENKDGRSTNLRVEYQNGDSIDVVYSEGEQFLLSSYDVPISVSKKNEFEGRIEFLNFACGCENIGPSIFYYGSLALGAILIPSGLYLTLKRSSNQAGDDNSE